MKLKPTIRRELAIRHRYGPDIARGRFVFVSYDGDPDTGGKLIAVCATAGEARWAYRAARDAEWHADYAVQLAAMVKGLKGR
jgi:hypothetical protein